VPINTALLQEKLRTSARGVAGDHARGECARGGEKLESTNAKAGGYPAFANYNYFFLATFFLPAFFLAFFFAAIIDSLIVNLGIV
jgi:hypothetical protein